MYHGILPIIAALVLAPAFVYALPNADAIVVFGEGKYQPDLITQFGGHVIDESKSLGMVHASIPLVSYAAIASDPSVQFIDLDGRVSISSDVPESAAEYSQDWGVVAIGAEEAHTSAYTGKGINIAVLDTGVDYTHPDLAPNFKGGYDFINEDDDPMDDNGHGTHVAGIIAAARDGSGVVGVAPEASIYAVKVSDSRGKGSFSGLIKGIDWAIEHDMDIVTMSITGTGGTRALQKAVEVAYHDYGIILVAAVGNGGSGEVLYPAAYSDVIGVGSVTADGTKSSFSRTGEEVELVAPGSDIESDAIGGKYRLSSGTSMATPFVTGAAALVLESDEHMWENTGAVDGDGEWTNDEVRAVLRETATDLGDRGFDETFGYGMLDLHFPAAAEDSDGEAENPSVMPVSSRDDPVTDSNTSTDSTISPSADSLWVRFMLSLG
ncbi:MAG TPA: S8 family peptidase [Nitrososphaera sp.]|nr:S8 family peptidase [Nitrososphaera sp.]